jgi:3D (Asp-Asp-Asp) domain-containing protein
MSPHRSPRVRLDTTLLFACLLATATACATGPRPMRTRVVTASAYTSHANQTRGDPFVAAWGDELSPDMKVIAVSRDLLREGLTRGTRVEIEGLPGEYVVLDKMNKRWREKIDIYMGEDVAAARRWGVREVRIQWREPAR